MSWFTSIRQWMSRRGSEPEKQPEEPEGSWSPGEHMFIVAGLGNPGAKYSRTKHNVGFDVVTQLADDWNIPQTGIAMKAMYGRGIIGGQRVLLIKPMTYMNLSGEAVRAFVNYYKVDPESDLIVVYDDIDLKPGRIRIRKKGSAGGHNGMKNIIAALGTDKFTRVRVGIGAKPPQWDLADYVLAPFSSGDRELVDGAVHDAADAVRLIISGETDRAMNLYNKEKDKEKATDKPTEKTTEKTV